MYDKSTIIRIMSKNSTAVMSGDILPRPDHTPRARW